jgi:hypothetical protein
MKKSVSVSASAELVGNTGICQYQHAFSNSRHYWKSLLLVALILIPMIVFAQKYRTIELKPITKQGWKYFYDLKSVSSPLALEVPLISLQDDEINRQLKASKTWTTVGALITIAPVIYLVSLPRNSYIEPTTFWWVFGATIAAQLGCEAIKHAKLEKAIDRYNYLILQPSGRSLGLELTWKFL